MELSYQCLVLCCLLSTASARGVAYMGHGMYSNINVGGKGAPLVKHFFGSSKGHFLRATFIIINYNNNINNYCFILTKVNTSYIFQELHFMS